jgi:single-stranded DNA-binding protein
MNSIALTGILAEEPELHEEGTAPVRCTMRLAVPRHGRGGQRTAGVVYVDATTFGLEARDCAERLRQGDRIGLTARLEQDEYVTPVGERRIDHTVLIDQLDLPPKQTPHKRRSSDEQDQHEGRQRSPTPRGRARARDRR